MGQGEIVDSGAPWKARGRELSNGPFTTVSLQEKQVTSMFFRIGGHIGTPVSPEPPFFDRLEASLASKLNGIVRATVQDKGNISRSEKSFFFCHAGIIA